MDKDLIGQEDTIRELVLTTLQLNEDPRVALKDYGIQGAEYNKFINLMEKDDLISIGGRATHAGLKREAHLFDASDISITRKGLEFLENRE